MVFCHMMEACCKTRQQGKFYSTSQELASFIPRDIHHLIEFTPVYQCIEYCVFQKWWRGRPVIINSSTLPFTYNLSSVLCAWPNVVWLLCVVDECGRAGSSEQVCALDGEGIQITRIYWMLWEAQRKDGERESREVEEIKPSWIITDSGQKHGNMKRLWRQRSLWMMSPVMVCFFQEIKTIGTANLSGFSNSYYRVKMHSLLHFYGNKEWPLSSPSPPLIAFSTSFAGCSRALRSN